MVFYMLHKGVVGVTRVLCRGHFNKASTLSLSVKDLTRTYRTMSEFSIGRGS